MDQGRNHQSGLQRPDQMNSQDRWGYYQSQCSGQCESAGRGDRQGNGNFGYNHENQSRYVQNTICGEDPMLPHRAGRGCPMDGGLGYSRNMDDNYNRCGLGGSCNMVGNYNRGGLGGSCNMGGNCNNGELSGNRNPDGYYNSGGLSGSRNLGGDYNNGGRGYPRENDRYDVMAETAGGGVGSMRDPSMNKAPPRAQVLPELGEKMKACVTPY